MIVAIKQHILMLTCWMQLTMAYPALAISIVESSSEGGLVVEGLDKSYDIPSVSHTNVLIDQMLGAATVNIIRKASKISKARISTTSLSEAERTALVDEQRVGGYPIAGKLSLLNKGEADRLTNWLLNEQSYISEAKVRCNNTKLLGVRFQFNAQKVEFVLGLPCGQGIWSFMTERGKHRRVTTLNSRAIEQLVNLLASPKVILP